MRLRVALHRSAHLAGHHGVLRTHRAVGTLRHRIAAPPVGAKLAEGLPRA